MELETRNFGTIEIKKEQIIHFPEGLPGFNAQKRYVILPLKNSQYYIMQSVDEKELAFVIIPSGIITSDYEFDISESEEEKLGVKSRKDLITFSIINTKDMTANLKAPLVINKRLNTGLQIVLDEEEYSLKYKITGENNIVGEKVTG